MEWHSTCKQVATIERLWLLGTWQSWAVDQQYTGWPLVWKTWKWQGIWNMSGNVRDVVNSQGNVREKI